MRSFSFFLTAVAGNSLQTYTHQSYRLNAYSYLNKEQDAWILNGDSRIDGAGLKLQDVRSGTWSWSWNRAPLIGNNFDIEIDLKISGPPITRNGEGIAIWLSEEKNVLNFVNGKNFIQDSLFGYRSNYKGLGVFISTNDRNNKPVSSISAAFNDGVTELSSSQDVPTSDGVYFDVRNLKAPLELKISVRPENIQGYMKMATEKEWKKTFFLNYPSIYHERATRIGSYLEHHPFNAVHTTNGTNMINKKEPSGLTSFAQSPLVHAYLGFTSTNLRVPPNETTVPYGAQAGDAITISRVAVSSSDPKWIVQTGDASARFFQSNFIQHVLEMPMRDTDSSSNSTKALDESSLSDHYYNSCDLMINNAVPMQELSLARINKLDQTLRMLAAKIEVLQAQVVSDMSESSFKKFNQILENSNLEHIKQLAEMQGTGPMKELTQRSETLESAVRKASVIALGTLGLGMLSFTVGIVLYKRMRDMEKKHLL